MTIMTIMKSKLMHTHTYYIELVQRKRKEQKKRKSRKKNSSIQIATCIKSGAIANDNVLEILLIKCDKITLYSILVCINRSMEHVNGIY